MLRQNEFRRWRREEWDVLIPEQRAEWILLVFIKYCCLLLELKFKEWQCEITASFKDPQRMVATIMLMSQIRLSSAAQVCIRLRNVDIYIYMYGCSIWFENWQYTWNKTTSPSSIFTWIHPSWSLLSPLRCWCRLTAAVPQSPQGLRLLSGFTSSANLTSLFKPQSP